METFFDSANFRPTVVILGHHCLWHKEQRLAYHVASTLTPHATLSWPLCLRVMNGEGKNGT